MVDAVLPLYATSAPLVELVTTVVAVVVVVVSGVF